MFVCPVNQGRSGWISHPEFAEAFGDGALGAAPSALAMTGVKFESPERSVADGTRIPRSRGRTVPAVRGKGGPLDDLCLPRNFF